MYVWLLWYSVDVVEWPAYFDIYITIALVYLISVLNYGSAVVAYFILYNPPLF